MQINPTSASSANVSGIATLTDGSVRAVLAPGSYAPGTQYTILHANGGLGGTTFSSVSHHQLPNFSYSRELHRDRCALDPHGGDARRRHQRSIRTSRTSRDAINGVFNGGGALPANFTSLCSV